MGVTAERLAKLAEDPTTDWHAVRARRDAALSKVDHASGEILAQAITWGCVSREPDSQRSHRLAEAFLELERAQPKIYQLPAGVKASADEADWPLVLRAVHGDPGRNWPSWPFLLEGLTELIVRTAAPKGATDLPLRSPLGQLATQLQKQLASAEPAPPRTGPDPDKLAGLVARKGCVELRMYKEDRHARPHFHIKYKREHAASYALDTFERLAGYMPRKYEEVILRVARGMGAQLMECWRSLNGNARVVLPGEAA
jgi:hypothetical protein